MTNTVRTCVILVGTLAFCLGGCITVQVIDERTSLPVSGATVQYTSKGMEGSRTIGRTDITGKLEFYVPDDLDMLYVTKPGYEPWERSNVWVVQNSSHDWEPVQIRLVKN